MSKTRITFTVEITHQDDQQFQEIVSTIENDIKQYPTSTDIGIGEEVEK